MSVNQLTLDQRKPWLNVRVNNLTVDGTITGGGSGGPAILYQTPSTISPPDNIIYKIGNADETCTIDTTTNIDMISPLMNITNDTTTITSGTTLFAGGGAVVMEGLGEFVNSQFDVKITTSGILTKKRYSKGTVTSGAAGIWSYTHGLGQIPDFYIATALSSASLVQDQNVISYNTATNTVVTGRVMQPAVVPSGGGAAMEYVTGVTVNVYCGML